MVNVQLRYVTKRVKKGGRTLWYWQRKGYPLARLPDNERARVAMALRLNEGADSQRDAGKSADYATFGWLVPRYRESNSYIDRAENTKRAYETWLRRFESEWRDLPIADADFTFVADFMKGLAEQGKTTQLPLAVLSNLFKQAKYDRVLKDNPSTGVSVVRPIQRDQVWPESKIKLLIDACYKTTGGKQMALAVQLMLHTAQRPVDIRAMTWAHWKDDGILVKQKKTKAYLQIWCHSELRASLAIAKAETKGLAIIATRKGQRVSQSQFHRWFKAACKAAGIADLQARDFRRTAVVKLAEAGCTVPEIAAVTGHTLQNVHQILETYLPRTPALTKTAILKMERAGNDESKRLDNMLSESE